MHPICAHESTPPPCPQDSDGEDMGYPELSMVGLTPVTLTKSFYKISTHRSALCSSVGLLLSDHHCISSISWSGGLRLSKHSNTWSAGLPTHFQSPSPSQPQLTAWLAQSPGVSH